MIPKVLIHFSQYRNSGILGKSLSKGIPNRHLGRQMANHIFIGKFDDQPSKFSRVGAVHIKFPSKCGIKFRCIGALVFKLANSRGAQRAQPRCNSWVGEPSIFRGLLVASTNYGYIWKPWPVKIADLWFTELKNAGFSRFIPNIFQILHILHFPKTSSSNLPRSRWVLRPLPTLAAWAQAEAESTANVRWQIHEGSQWP